MNNNVIIFTFGFFFLLIAFLQPVIRAEFENKIIDQDIGDLEDELGQADVSSTGAIAFLVSLFFWVVGAPAWLNIIIIMMRVTFWVVVYDKIRGVGS